MKIETQTLENHQAKLIVEVEAEVLEGAKRRAAREIAGRMKIPGFRPGKAPYAVIERTVGAENILKTAWDNLAQEMYPKALKESGLKPYAPAEYKEPTAEAPTKFEFSFPLDAEVKLGDYHTIRIPYAIPPVSDEQVEDALQELRLRNAVIEPVERPAQVGDQVDLKLSAELKQANEGENPILIEERSLPVNIPTEGQGDRNEWPFPGFSGHLLDLHAGDEKSFDYTFPADADYTSLQGKEATFHFKVEQIKSRTLPDVTDEFATTVGDYADLAELRSKIRQSLEGQAKSECDYEYSEKILTELVNSATIQYPPQMLEEQIDHSIKRLENRLANQKMDLPTYLKTRKMDTAALRDELKPQAEASLIRTLVLYEVADSEKIQLGRDDIANEMTQAMENYSRFMDPKQLQKLGKDKGFVENLARQTSVDLITQRTFERLQAIAKGELEAEVKAEQTTPSEEATLPTATPESAESSPESGHETPAEKAAE